MALKNSDQPNLDPSFKSVLISFSEQVQKTPKKIAVVFENNCLSYEQLDLRSDVLAKNLINLGAAPNTVIGLSLQNSLDLVIGILGIIKSGATYLPIDPKYPIDRIRYIINDANPIILITENKLKSNFNDLSNKIFFIDKLNTTFSSTNLRPISKEDLAYIFYTSGSTGKPKGILVNHEAFYHAIFAYRNYYPECINSLMLSSISFDASILIIFYTLLFGDTVFLPNMEEAIDGEKIIHLIKDKSLDFIFCVPSFYKMILEKSNFLPSLKNVTLAGENLPNLIPDLHARFAPNATLYNAYGPTEYAIGATIAKIYDPITRSVSPITIGKAYPDTKVCILDENRCPVANGVKGEIYISGKGLAKGYLNKPDLTKEKFTSIRLPDEDQEILFYKTGDLGRFLPDGNIEFLGRIDHQVKIRGYRIELGEIEHVLCQHPKVDEAIVVVQEKESKQLVAFYSTDTSLDLKEELKNYLENTLPSYMVPSILYKVNKWPITPNGKIDRTGLLDLLKNAPKRDKIAHKFSSAEKTLFDIWSQVLRTDSFSFDDNFFDLGGDSVQLADVQNLIKDRLAAEINIVDLFQYPTFKQLAKYLQSISSNEKLDLRVGS